MITLNGVADSPELPAVDRSDQIAPGNARRSESQSNDIARQFEAVFLSMMLKQMRSTGLGEGLFAGDKSDMLGSMFDQYLGEHLADSGGLGLATMLAKAGVGTDAKSSTRLTAVSQSAGLEAYEHASRIQ
jgi:Rod binding domain-containing protein